MHTAMPKYGMPKSTRHYETSKIVLSIMCLALGRQYLKLCPAITSESSYYITWSALLRVARFTIVLVASGGGGCFSAESCHQGDSLSICFRSSFCDEYWVKYFTITRQMDIQRVQKGRLPRVFLATPNGLSWTLVERSTY